MNEIRTRVVVRPDHGISGTAPDEVPMGEHDVAITVAGRAAWEPAGGLLEPSGLPRHDLGTWPEGLSLRREDMYGARLPSTSGVWPAPVMRRLV